MPPFTLQEFYVYAVLFVLAITLYIAVVIATSKKIIKWDWCIGQWVRTRNSKWCPSIMDISFKIVTVVTAPLRWLCYPFLYLIAAIYYCWEWFMGKADQPYDREKDPEYIRMMQDVGSANSTTGMPHSLRRIYSELYNVSNRLDKDDAPKEIYQSFKESRLDDLIAYKASDNIDNLKIEVACDISTLAYFWEDRSIERTTFFLLTALDYQTQTEKVLSEADPE